MIAAFVMQGRMQAVMAATLFAMIAMVMPFLAPVSIASAAVAGLVTLRLGARPGVEVIALATAAMALLGLPLFGSASIAIVSIVIWLPMLLLGMLLRSGGSLSLAVQAALLVGLVPLLIEQFFLTNSGWQEFLFPLQKLLIESQKLDPGEIETVVAWLNRWLTAFMAAGLFLQTCLALFLARSWQAKLVNPGGFREEFYALRISRTMVYAATAIMLLFFVAKGDQWPLMRLAAIMLVTLFFLQGLAVLHALLAKSKAGEAWLIGIYILMLFALPYMAVTLAATGFADSWMDLRKANEDNRSDGSGNGGDSD
jgi:hypothetical protein